MSSQSTSYWISYYTMAIREWRGIHSRLVVRWRKIVTQTLLKTCNKKVKTVQAQDPSTVCYDSLSLENESDLEAQIQGVSKGNE